MTDQNTNVEIGGYYSFVAMREYPEDWGKLYRFQSARAALWTFLDQVEQIKTIHLPFFICDSVLAAVRAANKKIEFYNIDENFLPRLRPNLKRSDALYVVNYFGLLSERLSRFIEGLNFENIILDNAQSLFSNVENENIIATIYSPRKFFALPDGGFLRTNFKISMPREIDNDSLTRIGHLVKRMSFAAESGYGEYVLAEKSLQAVVPKNMSNFTNFLLTSIDIEEAKSKRRENYYFYSEQLHNTLGFELDATSIPLCFPFLADRPGLKELLIRNQIYIPTYWPEVTNRVTKASFEKKLVDLLCPLPSDHRYQKTHVAHVCKVLKEEF